MVALKCTGYRRPIATPLHQPSLHHLSEGLIGSADVRKDVEQLQLLVRRVEVEQRDDEDDRRARPPTILRKQQRSTGRTCAEKAGRALLRLRKPSLPPYKGSTSSAAGAHHHLAPLHRSVRHGRARDGARGTCTRVLYSSACTGIPYYTVQLVRGTVP